MTELRVKIGEAMAFIIYDTGLFHTKVAFI